MKYYTIIINHKEYDVRIATLKKLQAQGVVLTIIDEYEIDEQDYYSTEIKR